MNRSAFFASARSRTSGIFGTSLSQKQVEGVEAILDEWDRRKGLDSRWLAYMLATAYHETNKTMQPIRELGGRKYLSKYDTGKLAKALGNTPQADGDGQMFAGRGLVQITGRANYRKFGIEATPDDALKMQTAVTILFDGMIKGLFTGKKLADFFSQKADDPIGARKIVNGKDKATLIAANYKSFLNAIEAGRDVVEPAATPSPVVIPEPVKPTTIEQGPSTDGNWLSALLAAIIAIFNRK